MLRPQRALVHPAFGLALAVLALNDHVFKGAHLLPSHVTGKASDFAGLLVAQVVLAVIARVRTRRGLVWVSLVLAAAFAAIKMSLVASAMYERALAFVHATNVVDPTDLVALAVLPLGIRLFAPAMGSSAPTDSVRRTFESLALLAALPFCIATSAPEYACEEGSVRGFGHRCTTAFEAWTFVYNAGTRDVDVTVREMQGPPAPPTALCELQSDAFLPPRTIHLRPGEAAPIVADGSPGGTRVALVDVGNGLPTAVFTTISTSGSRQKLPKSGWLSEKGREECSYQGGIGVDQDAIDGRVYRECGSTIEPLDCGIAAPEASTIEDAPTELDAGVDQ